MSGVAPLLKLGSPFVSTRKILSLRPKLSSPLSKSQNKEVVLAPGNITNVSEFSLVFIPHTWVLPKAVSISIRSYALPFNLSNFFIQLSRNKRSCFSSLKNERCLIFILSLFYGSAKLPLTAYLRQITTPKPGALSFFSSVPLNPAFRVNSSISLFAYVFPPA